MTPLRHVLAGAVVLLAGVFVLSCQDTATDAPPVITPATSPLPATQKRTAPLPPSIIKMQKPKLLGPVIPAVIALPAGMKEPMIRVRLTGEESGIPSIQKSAYRGHIQNLKLPDGNWVAINVLPMDSYLMGVLSKELYGSWDPAAYRTQAIAARTFALFQILSGGPSKPWDVNNDESSQVYGGIAGETAKSKAAVNATRGMVLTTTTSTASGIFCSFYSSCIGGASQDPAEAWGDPAIATLSARKIGPVDSECPKYAWPAMLIPKVDITRCIKNWGEKNGFAYLQTLGSIQSVTISKRNPTTGRPTEFKLIDTAGKSAPIRAEEFRLALVYDPLAIAPKPFSSNFNIKDAGTSIEIYNGRGYGHGIGLSQWGAQALALKGWQTDKILAFYYPGAHIQKAW